MFKRIVLSIIFAALLCAPIHIEALNVMVSINQCNQKFGEIWESCDRAVTTKRGVALVVCAAASGVALHAVAGLCRQMYQTAIEWENYVSGFTIAKGIIAGYLAFYSGRALYRLS